MADEGTTHPARNGALEQALAEIVRALSADSSPAAVHEAEKRLHAAVQLASGEDHASRFLDAIIENIPDMIFVKDAERLAFKRFNRAGEKLLGVPRAELIGKNDYDFFPPDQARFFQDKDRNTLHGKTLVDIEQEPIETANGQRWLHTKKVPILDENGTPIYLLGISEDITDKKEDEDARRRLAAIVDSSSDAILSTTLDDQISTWNRGAEKLFGYRAEEVIGKPLTILIPDDRTTEHDAILARLKHGESIAWYSTLRKRHDGSLVDVSISASVIYNRMGEAVGFSKIARDITELKRAELAILKARDDAEAANRELESFSYSVAHDLRAPLRAIDGFSQALLEDCGDVLSSDGRDHLERVRKNAQHMAQLIDALLTLSRMTRGEIVSTPVDIGAIARTSMDAVRRLHPAHSVTATIQDGMVARGDIRLLAVVFDNLLANAWKFTGKKSDARVEVGCELRDGRTVYFVRDNGAGFDMAFANKLFGVFQRLHPVSEFEGTGVGLATVQRIIRRHDGSVWAHSAPEQGATFYFTLNERPAVIEQ